ncbi:MAG: HAMP domain-containing histidine kinase [Actinobacteria bacterium]|nr:HAMP domain-containing histidine kinase [Actinomycetota bacterium]
MRARGLRARITAVFALGALALSVALAGATYELTRQSLLDERERAAVRAAYFDAALIRQGLGGDDPDLAEVLRSLDTGETRRPLIRRDGQWFARTADDGLTEAVPQRLQRLVEQGTPAVQRVSLRAEPALVVGVPLQEGASYYELTELTELRSTLTVLATVLGLVALVTTLAGAGVGWWASRRVLRPLGDVASAAGIIASGDFTARVGRDRDPDLDKLAVAFNQMVDEVSARSEADRRFAADVSHELRSPLQTLSAATSVLDRRREQLDDRSAAAVALLTDEVARFESLVTDLLELARSDRAAERRPTDVVALTRAVLESRRLAPAVLSVSGPAVGEPAAMLDIDPRRYEQLLVNLIDNAAKHGGGAVRIGLSVEGGALTLEVDDEGPGVPVEERELVFDRFARGRTASARGGSEGTGLGLALVLQHVQAHRGTVLVTDRPGGGARFRVTLPGGRS